MTSHPDPGTSPWTFLKRAMTVSALVASSSLDTLLLGTAVVFGDSFPCRTEYRSEYAQGFMRIMRTTQKDIEGDIVDFRPCVDTDVGFCEYGDTGNAAGVVRPLAKGVQPDLQHGRFAGPCSVTQCFFDRGLIL